MQRVLYFYISIVTKLITISECYKLVLHFLGQEDAKKWSCVTLS